MCVARNSDSARLSDSMCTLHIEVASFVKANTVQTKGYIHRYTRVMLLLPRTRFILSSNVACNIT
jgi:hypothetical protein